MAKIDRRKTPRTHVWKPPTAFQVERAIGTKASAWAGNCHRIAAAVVNAGLVCGRVAHGHWLGSAAPGTFFEDLAAAPFIRHGWIVSLDGSIVDPTRWVFEGVAPYVWHGPPSSLYDECGRLWRAKMKICVPAPAYDRSDKVALLPGLSNDAKIYVGGLLGSPPTLTRPAMTWLATLPPAELRQYAHEVYVALEAAGLRREISDEDWHAVMGSHEHAKAG